MNAKFPAECAAAMLPLAHRAASDSAAPGLAMAGADLPSPGDCIGHASINDDHIHEPYFSTMLHEGTESIIPDRPGWTD